MCNVSGVTAINTGGDLVQPELPFASGPRYNVPPASHTNIAIRFSWYVLPVTLFFTSTGETFTDASLVSQCCDFLFVMCSSL